MVETLLEPFSFAFMQRAFLAITLASLCCSAVGCFIILRRMAFIGGALTHTLLPGVVLAHLLGWMPWMGGLFSSLATVWGVGWLSSSKGVREDTAIGIALSGMFALGVVLMGFAGSFQDFGSLLFGSLLGVQAKDLVFVGGAAVLILAVLVRKFRALELSAYDAEYAQQVGISPRRMHYLLLVLAGLAVVTAVEIVGALLTTALLVIPPATASLFAKSLKGMLAGACGFGVLSGLAGLYVSFFWDLPSGAAVVLVSVFGFLLGYAGKCIFGFRKKLQ